MTTAKFVPIRFAWKLPDGRWLRAVFRTEMLEYDPPNDRWICRLHECLTDLSLVPVPISQPVTAITGMWARIPQHGIDGNTLALKLDTLRGHPKYFFAQDPREQTI